MKKKFKVTIVIAILLFLGLGIFTFASPDDEPELLDGGKVQNVNGNNTKEKYNYNKTTPSLDEELEGKEEEVTGQVLEVPRNNINNVIVNNVEVDETEEVQPAGPANEEAPVDVTAPEVEVTYSSTVATKEGITVTITSNEKLQALEGWELSEDGLTLTRTFTKNITETFHVEDEAGNVQDVAVVIENIDNVKPTITVNETSVGLDKVYSRIDVTLADNNALNFVKINEEVKKINLTGNEQVLTFEDIKEYLVEGENTIRVKDKAGNQYTLKFTLDTIAPKVTIKSSSVGTEGVYSLIDFKITDNVNLKEAVLNDSYTTNKDGASRSLNFANYGTRYVQGENTWVVYDEAGNSTTVTFIFDTVAPTVRIRYENAPTNEYVILRFIADEEIQAVEGYALVQDNTILRKFVYENEAGEMIVTDLAGNTTTVKYSVVVPDVEPAIITLPGIQGRSAMEYRVERGKKVALEDVLADVSDNRDGDLQMAPYRADLLIGTKEENTYNYDFSNGFDTSKTGRYNVYYKYVDQAGNVSEATLLIVITDKTPAHIDISYSTIDWTNGNVVVTLTSNEELQAVDGWELSNDKLTLTKEFESNIDETIVISDLAGNTTEVAYEITNIDKDEPVGTVTYSTVDPTKEAVIVTVTANEEIQEAEGWTLSNDKKSISMKVTENTTGLVKIKDLAGNESDAITYSVANIDKTAPTVMAKNSSAGTNGIYSKIDIQTSDNDSIVKAVLNGTKTFNRTPGKSKSFNFADYGKNYVEGENTLVVYDAAGNTTEFKFVLDTTPASRVYSTIRANENKKEIIDGVTYYKLDAGDSFEFAIQFTEELAANPVATIAGTAVELKLNESVKTKENKFLYEGKYTLSEENELPAGVLDITLSNIKDLAGNESTSVALLDQTKTSNSRSVMIESELADNMIVSAKQLRDIAANPTNYKNKTLILGKDIDLAGEEWTPIDGWDGKLNGLVLDGNGHSIKNMTITDSTDAAIGFIGRNASSVTIKNLTFEGAKISQTNEKQRYAGVLMGKNYSTLTFENINVIDSEVKNNWQAGGIIGFGEDNTMTFKNCSVEDTFIGGEKASAGILYGLGKANINVDGCRSKNVDLYTDSLTWASDNVKYHNNWTGYVYDHTQTVTNSTEENTRIIVMTPSELANIFKNGAYLEGNTITLGTDLDMTGIEWTPADNVGFVLDGANHTISNLTYEGTGDAGAFLTHLGNGKKVTIKNLTLDKANISSTSTKYATAVGGFIGTGDTAGDITILNSTIKNSNIALPQGDGYAAGFVGYTAGWNVVTDGPVYATVTIDGCSLLNTTVIASSSAGGAVAHAGANADTTTTVSNFTAKNNTITGERVDKTGIVIGTANVGHAIINNVTSSNNTVFGTENSTAIYGRFVPNETGTLVIDGVEVTN